MKERNPAFTIIELIITTAVIAILATISYVAYTSISRSAAEATMHSDLNQASKLLAIDKTRNNNTYPLTKEQANRGNGLKASDQNQFQYTSDGQEYCLTITSTRANTKSFKLSSNNDKAEEGTCAGHTDGTGNIAIVTNGTHLQAITTANCPTTRIMAVDARDNRTYWVQKLADDKCWMLTNLAYAGGGTNTYNDTIPTGDGTNGTLHGPDNSGSTTYTLAKYYTHAGANPTTNPTQPSTDTTGGGSGAGRQYGYLYNWCAAMGAQNGGSKPNTSACANATTPAPNTAISICPSGWRLPTGQATTGDFTLLNNAVNGGLTNTDAGLRSEWLAQRSGGWNSGFDGQGSYGYYWSSTQASATYGLGLYFGSSYVYPSDTSNKSYGFAVRCVAA